jgi:hypothetical protein
MENKIKVFCMIQGALNIRVRVRMLSPNLGVNNLHRVGRTARPTLQVKEYSRIKNKYKSQAKSTIKQNNIIVCN